MCNSIITEQITDFLRCVGNIQLCIIFVYKYMCIIVFVHGYVCLCAMYVSQYNNLFDLLTVQEMSGSRSNVALSQINFIILHLHSRLDMSFRKLLGKVQKTCISYKVPHIKYLNNIKYHISLKYQVPSTCSV